VRLADQLGDHVQHEIDPGGDAGAGQPPAVLDVQPIIEHPRRWGERGAALVMRRAAVAVEQPGPRGDSCVRIQPRTLLMSLVRVPTSTSRENRSRFRDTPVFASRFHPLGELCSNVVR
jgi:hypothetical protein